MILNVDVVNKIATFQKRGGCIVCGNSDYQIQFSFDREWDAHDKKTARFICNGQFTDVDFDKTKNNNICTVPILYDTTEVEVGVYAGELKTTTSALIGCYRSILCEGVKPSEENDRLHINEAKEAADRAEAAAKLVEYIAEHLFGIEPEEPTLPKLTPPIIELYSDDVKLETPVIEIYSDDVPIIKLEPPIIEIYSDIIVEPEEPEPIKLETPVIEIYSDDVPIIKLEPPIIEIYSDIIVEPEEPEPIKLETPVIELYEYGVEEPTLTELAPPVIVLYDETTDEPETPTIIQLATPSIYMDISNTYSIEPNRSYLLPAIPDGRETRSFAVWVKVEAVDDNGNKYYDEITQANSFTDISNQDYVIKVSGMETDYEGDCFFKLTIDGMFTRSVYAVLPKHSTCKIAEAKVVDVGDCIPIADTLDTPVIELYEDSILEPEIPKLATPSIYKDVA